MSSVQQHLRKTFLAGAFAAMPIAVTAFVVWYVDAKTRILSREIFGANVPFLGALLAVAAIYLLGLAVTSLLGRFCLRAADRVLSRLPLLKPVYQTWKQVVLAPGEGIFAKVVLVADETGRMDMLGFTSGVPTGAGGDRLCVFVPAAPNPTSGRLYFVRREHCQLLDLSAEEAFKMILSGGSYVPAGIAFSGDASTATVVVSTVARPD
jgi:uncharacterized membrane protein